MSNSESTPLAAYNLPLTLQSVLLTEECEYSLACEVLDDTDGLGDSLGCMLHMATQQLLSCDLDLITSRHTNNNASIAV